ncbi:MAG: L-fucose:H+ symporter permease [Bacteroidia bacterium]|nr:L-fucose:H+ symporter permease [Bacteroidia bacterium]
MRRSLLLPFILVTSLFFLWGIANNMTDTLLSAFKRIMSMTDFQTSFVQLAFYGSYCVLALPAALFIRRFTYKSGILLGLGLFAAGGLLFYPASITMEYSHFLAALFVLAGGLSILETTANPYIIAMGDPATGTRRLNLAQSFNPIGAITGVVLSKFFILSELDKASAAERASMTAEQLSAMQSTELSAVMGPYVGVSLFLILLWVLIAMVKMPKATDEGTGSSLASTFGRLVRNRQYLGGIASQFFYMGAQIGVWSYIIRYVMQELNIDEDGASSYYIASLIVFTVSRFVTTGMMQKFPPAQMLAALGLLGVVLTVLVMASSGPVSVYAMVMISVCLSLMFPTNFGLALEGITEDRKIGGSGLIMAMLGGALIPVLQGKISDLYGINASFGIPLICFALVSLYGWLIWQTKWMNPAKA